MSTGFSFGSGTLGSTTVAAGGTGTGGGFSFGTGASR
ncbi:NUP58 isoform 6 [Pongo abelii]|uniref:NUP58 isoform 6 n=1 Tax=Pongo abelii TaxID=9601 RepID=A0A2J8R289_PONAB|nr:NUP58 isoform 6 [Pongo abelii]